MATKKKTPVAKPKVPAAEPVKPQFVTEVVEDVPAPSLSEGPEEALETIKEKAEEIEEVVEEIREDLPAGKAGKKEGQESEDGETAPIEEVKKEEDKEVLEEIFTKKPSPAVYPDITEHKRLGAAPVFLWAVIIIGVALLTGGTLLVVASGIPKFPALFAKPTPTPIPTDVGTPTPTPTPATAARGDIKLQVLNGGGTPGSAGKAKSLLEEKGYTVADVGNTDEYTYKETEIHVKAEKEAYLTLLKEDLAQDYTIGTASADLPADSSYDARVIIGKE